MSEQTPQTRPIGPVTTVVTRAVETGHEADYRQWVLRSLDEALAFPNSLGATVVSAEPGDGNVHRLSYTFRDTGSARAWQESAVNRRLSEAADAFSTVRKQPAGGVASSVPASRESAVPPPAKWKMALSTFVVAYILTAVIIPREQAWFPKTWSFYATNVITNVLLAVGITYIGLPLVTRLLGRWLYPAETPTTNHT